MMETDTSFAHAAYCPHCRLIANLRVCISPGLVTGPDGKEKIIFSRTYHCEACGLFVESEEDELISKALITDL